MKSGNCNIPSRIPALRVVWGPAVLVLALTLCAWAGAPDGVPLAGAIERARLAGIEKTSIDRIVADDYLRSLEGGQTVRLLDRLAALPGHFPRGGFVAKAEEGLSKRVAMGRILAALDGLQENYAFGSQLLGNRLHRVEAHEKNLYLSIMADSLELGLPRQAVVDLARRFPSGTPLCLAVAAEIKALLRQISFDADQLDAIIAAGISGKRFDLTWRKLPDIVRLALQRGLPSAVITRSVIDALQQGRAIRSLLLALAFSRRDLVSGPAGE